MLRALVSIHDVMPETREAVARMLHELQVSAPQLRTNKITLLIVPGRDWRAADLRWLDRIADQGYCLAGHGWHHLAPANRTIYHQLHSIFFSRNAAEHLSQNRDQLLRMMENCFHWFGQQGYLAPKLYVPPAWAVGAFKPNDWQLSPFERMETLWGLADLNTRRTCRLPLCGFEADNVIRALFLICFNNQNILRAQTSKAPLRIALHPYDLQLKLSDTIYQLLQRVQQFEDYSISIRPSANVGNKTTRE